MNPKNKDLFEAFVAEVKNHAHDKIKVEFTLPELIQHISQLQLALRHQKNKGPASEYARKFIEQAARMIGNLPAVQEIIRRGFDPTYDEP